MKMAEDEGHCSDFVHRIGHCNPDLLVLLIRAISLPLWEESPTRKFSWLYMHGKIQSN